MYKKIELQYSDVELVMGIAETDNRIISHQIKGIDYVSEGTDSFIVNVYVQIEMCAKSLYQDEPVIVRLRMDVRHTLKITSQNYERIHTAIERRVAVHMSDLYSGASVPISLNDDIFRYLSDTYLLRTCRHVTFKVNATYHTFA